MSNQILNENRTQLFVSDFLDTETQESLINFFNESKDKITHIEINKNKRNLDYSSKNNATVFFTDSKSASEAIKKYNLRKLNNKTLRIMWHDGDNNSRYNSQNNLFIKNIPEKVDPRQFYEHFLKFGEIISAKLNVDDSGKHYGYGYINYKNPESAIKALEETDGKAIWEGTKLEVKHFLKKNERLGEGNKNVYIKNIPNDFTDKDIYNLFEKYGVVTWAKVIKDNNANRKFAIVNFENDESVQVAIDGTNGKKIGENLLFVNVLMKKNDRVKYLNINYNSLKYCNLHVRNIPFQVKENELCQNFEQFGEIKSVRISKKPREVLDQGKKVMVECSEGFGYVCFHNPDSAKTAIEKMNGGFLKKHEYWKYPLIVDYFMPKKERVQFLNRVKQVGAGFAMNPMFNAPNQYLNNQFGQNMMMPMFPQNNNFQAPQLYQPNNYGKAGNMGPKQINYGQNQRQFVNQNFNEQNKGNKGKAVQIEKNEDQPDLNYLNSLEDESSKKDYLGEFIFKQIENHSISQKKKLYD